MMNFRLPIGLETPTQTDDMPTSTPARSVPEVASMPTSTRRMRTRSSWLIRQDRFVEPMEEADFSGAVVNLEQARTGLILGLCKF